MSHRIGILVFDGMTLLDASGPAEVFHLADPSRQHYELIFVSIEGGSVTASSGLVLADTVAVSEAGSCDTVLVTGGEALVTPRQDAELMAAVQSLSAPAQRVASVCTGAFVLAALGYLNGRRVTTHWRHANLLARWYPQILVEPDVIHLQDGRFLTSAGVTAGIDLALAIVEDDLGVEVARNVARELVMFMHRPGGQSQFSHALSRPAAKNELLRTVLEKVASDLPGDHTVTSMATAAGVSVRHLNRIFHAELGTSPARWVEQIRLDGAQTLILQGHPVTRVAQLSGIGTDETLRRAFARQLGTTPTAFRERFSTTR